MLTGFCRPPIHVQEAFGDDREIELFADEAAVVARAVAKRRAEFTTVRGCARAALAELGVPPTPLVPGRRGEPTWPAGVVGSMTHCDGYRAAAVARSTEIVAIGIDAEPDMSLPEGVLDVIALPEDLTVLPDSVGVSWDRVLLCAKEALFKAWYPLARTSLDFDEAHVTLDPMGHFSAHLLRPGPDVDGRPIQIFTGRWVAEGGLIAAVVTVPASH